MLASGRRDIGATAQLGQDWVVLVDSDMHAVTDKDVDREHFGGALPPRLRFTIAHELAHMLAFRQSDFGLRLVPATADARTAAGLVTQMEKEADTLSPLLLLPPKALDECFPAGAPLASIEELSALRASHGVSRDVLVNRLRLLATLDLRDLEKRPALSNLACGVGEWVSSHHAVLRQWPLYQKFHRGITPSFVLRLLAQDRLPVSMIFDDPEFWLCGGDLPSTTLELLGGTVEYPTSEKMKIACSVERVPRSAGRRFLFLVQRMSAQGDLSSQEPVGTRGGG
jgi:hypothetical protein